MRLSTLLFPYVMAGRVPAIRSGTARCQTWLASLILIILVQAPCTAAERYPGTEWQHIAPAQAGWSADQLAHAQDWSQTIGTSAVVVVQHGAIVAEWGDVTANILLNSARKSLLSALIGIAVGHHQIDPNATLAELGIDDNPPSLTAEEKQATVRDLLEARSGVYHPAAYETPGMAAERPPRGSHAPGTFWYYNNWDFNTLGAIYEHAVGQSVFTAFAQQIAQPIGMQDFNAHDCRYYRETSSNYPAYLFFASARDLARFGLLFLHHGRWRNQQVIPAAWVDESTRPYSTTEGGAGYGYLWWTAFSDRPLPAWHLPPGSYFANGNGGQMVFVIPSDDLVIVHLARMGSAAAHPAGVGHHQVAQLLGMILDAANGH